MSERPEVEPPQPPEGWDKLKFKDQFKWSDGSSGDPGDAEEDESKPGSEPPFSEE